MLSVLRPHGISLTAIKPTFGAAMLDDEIEHAPFHLFITTYTSSL